jgi:hypothetical protein
MPVVGRQSQPRGRIGTSMEDNCITTSGQYLFKLSKTPKKMMAYRPDGILLQEATAGGNNPRRWRVVATQLLVVADDVIVMSNISPS